jgi:hypothetical protein
MCRQPIVNGICAGRGVADTEGVANARDLRAPGEAALWPPEQHATKTAHVKGI